MAFTLLAMLYYHPLQTRRCCHRFKAIRLWSSTRSGPCRRCPKVLIERLIDHVSIFEGSPRLMFLLYAPVKVAVQVMGGGGLMIEFTPFRSSSCSLLCSSRSPAPVSSSSK
jgi:hypothetical protein